ncbi:MAG TPA: hypothetical protein VFP16_10455, partial [Vicinamibacterales bacterium]|nr:hypothetical protein [Vicinamibacterales bacterium]
MIGGVTRSKLADRADPDEDFIKSSDDEPSPLATIGIVKDVMTGIVDPNAMAIWDAVGAESTANGGVVEKAPKTDAEWAVVEHNALTLAEAANLLFTPG